jgi:UTP--glucose-1-phosphate uridylyltransferase
MQSAPSPPLAEQLDALPADLRARLDRYGFDRERLIAQSERLKSNLGPEDNRVHGNVEPPAPGDVGDFPSRGSAEWVRLEAIGMEALRRGECALVTLAGGMATRMGSVVKALVEALPGRTFLDIRMAELRALEKRVGRAAPFWFMTSHATEAGLRAALGQRVDGERIAVFAQRLSLRLTLSGDLYFDAEGKPSEYAPGHGDLPDALRQSGLLGRFVARGGRAVMVSNLDNLGATLEPMVLGWHLDHGSPVTCEVVDKVGSDRGGIPVRLDQRPVVLEEFRLPEGFDPSSVRVFNTNTFMFDARALLELDMPWTYFTVKKQLDGVDVVQMERLIGEVTSHLETRFLRVPRTGADSRFLPVKDPQELEQRRPDIEAVARARGILA